MNGRGAAKRGWPAGPLRFAAAAVMAGAIASAAAGSGLRAHYQDERPGADPIVVEVSEAGDFRVRAHDGGGTLLGVSGTVYLMETRADGTASVARLDDLAAAIDTVLFSGSGGPAGLRAGRALPAKPPGAKRIGSQTVAGVEGELWHVPEVNDLVVTRAPELAPLGKAIESYMALVAMHAGSALGIRATDMLNANRVLGGLGTLIQLGDGLRLTALEPAEIDPERFRLPAEPKSREELLRELRGEAGGR
jgi:hypothetical protein